MFGHDADRHGQADGVSLWLDPLAVPVGPGAVRAGDDEAVDTGRVGRVGLPRGGVGKAEFFYPGRKIELKEERK